MNKNSLISYLQKKDFKSEDFPFKENVNHLFGNLYFVRTQAGLKQAIVHYAGGYDEDFPTFAKILEHLNFRNSLNLKTIKYPLIIEFFPLYFGYHLTECNIHSF